MQVTGMLYGARMLRLVGFPTTEGASPVLPRVSGTIHLRDHSW
jgi:hypothetical protein